MPCIYYMYIKGTTVGYIGQDGGDGVKRIEEHIKSAASNSPDAVGRMINQYGISKIAFKVFGPPYYGLSAEIFEKFLNQWSYSGSGEDAYLDLAELLHIIRAKLLNTSAARFNTLIGGFQASGVDATLTYQLTIPNNVNQTAVNQVLQNFRTSLQEHRFSVDLKKFEDSWRKIVYPMGYLILTGPFREALLRYFKNNLLDDLFSSQNVVDIFKEYTLETIKNGGKKDPVLTRKLNRKIVAAIRENFDSQTSVINTNIKSILHQALGARYTKDFKFSWRTDSKVLDVMCSNIFNRISDISNLMWSNIAKEVNGTIIIDSSLITKRGAKANAQDISTNIYNLTNSIFTSFTWDKTVEPDWATELRKVVI